MNSIRLRKYSRYDCDIVDPISDHIVNWTLNLRLNLLPNLCRFAIFFSSNIRIQKILGLISIWYNFTIAIKWISITNSTAWVSIVALLHVYLEAWVQTSGQSLPHSKFKYTVIQSQNQSKFVRYHGWDSEFYRLFKLWMETFIHFNRVSYLPQCCAFGQAQQF